MSNIAIYSRKSKFTGKGESIENQIKKCKEFIKFKFEIDPENIDIYIDEDFTGRNENRPKFQEMISKIKLGEINSIVIYQLNRFGRNARDIHNSMAMCEEHNCVMYSATEGFDTSTSFGRAIMGILASLAQLETEQLGERVKDNMYTLAKMGRWLGGQSPLGFDGTREYYIDEYGKERSITKLKKNEDELKIVKSIYKKYLEEKSLSQVAKWSLSNYLKGKNKGNLDKSAINTIIQNPVYVKSTPGVLQYLEKEGYEVCGDANGNGMLRYGQKDECIIAVAKHKGVIEADDWLRVQRILKENTEKAPRLGKTNTALLTGILRCSCGAPMVVIHGQKNKDGIKQFYYACNMKINSSGSRCNSKNINGLLLEDKLLNYLKLYSKEQLITLLNESLIRTKNIENQMDTSYIENQIMKSNKAIQQLLNKLKLVTDEEVSKILLEEIANEKNKIKGLEVKKSDVLNDQSELITSQVEMMNILNLLDDFINNFEGLSFDKKKKQFHKIFENIVYKDDTFDISFNVKKN